MDYLHNIKARSLLYCALWERSWSMEVTCGLLTQLTTASLLKMFREGLQNLFQIIPIYELLRKNKKIDLLPLEYLKSVELCSGKILS